jgi:hypothetical protein
VLAQLYVVTPIAFVYAFKCEREQNGPNCDSIGHKGEDDDTYYREHLEEEV